MWNFIEKESVVSQPPQRPDSCPSLMTLGDQPRVKYYILNVTSHIYHIHPACTVQEHPHHVPCHPYHHRHHNFHHSCLLNQC